MKNLVTMPAERRLSLLLTLTGTVLFVTGTLSVVLFYGVNIDEGYNSQVSRNLLRYGAYGSKTLAGIRWFDPHVSTGPIVLLPVALSFLVLGDGILQARLVPLTFAVLTMLILAVLTKRLFGPLSAGLAVLLFAITPQAFWITGQVLGEGAAVCMILSGLLLWTYAEDNRNPALACGAGVLWGLSVWAKPSMVMAVLFIACGLGLHVLLTKPLGVTLPAIAGATSIAVAATWFFLPVLFSVESGYLLQPGVASSLVSQQFKATVGKNALRNSRVLLRTLGGAVLLATPLGIYHLRRSRALRASPLLAYIIPCAWITWWLLFHEIPIHQHLVPGLLIGAMPLAAVLTLVLRGRGGAVLGIYRVALVGLVTVSVILSIGNTASHFKGLGEAFELKSAQSRFAAGIASLEPDAEVYGFGWLKAWDIAFLSDRYFGSITSATELPDGRSYLVITPTTQRNTNALHSLQDIAGKCSGETVLVEPPWYHLYEVESPCPGG